MKITRKIGKEIREAIMNRIGRRRVEVGYRSWDAQTADEDGYNFLRWGEGHDLDGTTEWKDFIGTEVKDKDGWVALDCYCYKISTLLEEGELDTNVYVLIDPNGRVQYCDDDDLGHREIINRIIEERS